MSRTRPMGAQFTVIAMVFCFGRAEGQSYSAALYRLPPLPQPESRNGYVVPMAVNDGGTVIGRASFFGTGGANVPNDETGEGFRYSPVTRELEELGVFPGGGNSGQATALSADGSVVAGTATAAIEDMTFQSRAYRWTRATGLVMYPIIPSADQEQTTFANAYGMTADGVELFGGCGGTFTFRSAYWPDASTALQFPNAQTSVPGYIQAVSADGSIQLVKNYTTNFAQVYRPGSTTPITLKFSTGQWSNPQSMSPDGQYFVGYADIIVQTKHVSHAFLYRLNGAMTDLGAPLSPTAQQSSIAFAVSTDGSTIIGTTSPVENYIFPYGWIWRTGRATISLADYFANELHLDIKGLNDIVGVAISPNGRWITGWASDPTDRAFQIGWLVDTRKPCPADFDGNGWVNGDDFDAFSLAFFLGDPSADFNGDGFVDGEDFDQFVIAFNAGC